MAIFGNRNVVNFSPVVVIVMLTLFNGFALQGVEANGEVEVGGECNWRKNCKKRVVGAGGNDWYDWEITCAVPQTQYPEKCSNNKHERDAFWGICKAVGSLDATEYGCPCGVHDGDCPSFSVLSRIFWPQSWIKDAWDHMGH
ncbi:uncharacterized protein UTRI_03659_B [Ustilago trichophora]|uniref:Uncharacterized protein n=1 Tax=Ustilago trichophora TaxID=86804 RepID=A0A5C3DZX5_9BASI|nr:uncharacterized protein UTRI_03659_B [Ustilago trichophora]